MKKIKKTNDNHILTKDYFEKKLDEKLEVFVTKDYLDKKLKDFVTKDYLEERFTHFEKKITGELLDIKVEIMGELKTMREESSAHQYSHLRIDETLEDHEKRLTNLGVPAM